MDLCKSSLSNKMNEVTKMLTIIATIFIPLSFVAGGYGMNFNPETSPFNMPKLQSYLGYLFALGIVILAAASLLLRSTTLSFPNQTVSGDTSAGFGPLFWSP